mmetsp:Transcript_19225/g.28617  ORF Transcript_19225/g.28617 Transcript_19225/m.28617 type:complete len:238 (-) Transcript_19225:1671-2384(-)
MPLLDSFHMTNPTALLPSTLLHLSLALHRLILQYSSNNKRPKNLALPLVSTITTRLGLRSHQFTPCTNTLHTSLLPLARLSRLPLLAVDPSNAMPSNVVAMHLVFLSSNISPRWQQPLSSSSVQLIRCLPNAHVGNSPRSHSMSFHSSHSYLISPLTLSCSLRVTQKTSIPSLTTMQVSTRQASIQSTYGSMQTKLNRQSVKSLSVNNHRSPSNSIATMHSLLQYKSLLNKSLLKRS